MFTCIQEVIRMSKQQHQQEKNLRDLHQDQQQMFSERKSNMTSQKEQGGNKVLVTISGLLHIKITI